jgi:hypothetical protein
MYPRTADAPAGVLAGCDEPSAAPASLTHGTRGIAVRRRSGRVFQAQAHRAGACHGNPDPAGAEMLQVRLTYALIDLDPLLPAPQVTSPPLSPRREA